MAVESWRDIDDEMMEVKERLDSSYSLERKGDGVWQLSYEDRLDVPLVTRNGNFSHRIQLLAQQAEVYEHDIGYAKSIKVKKSLEDAGFLENGELTKEIPEEVSDIMTENDNSVSMYGSEYGIDEDMKIQVAEAVRDSDLGHAKSRMLTGDIDLDPKEVGKTLSMLENEYDLDPSEFRTNRSDISWNIELLVEEGFVEDYLEEE